MLRIMEHAPHILVVDDDRDIRDLLARFLEEKHHMRVTAVRDAREARRAFASSDLISKPQGNNLLWL